MLFTQPIFALFFVTVLASVWAARSNRQRKLLLLAASYVFYAAWDWRFLSLILFSTSIDYLAGLRIHASDRGGKGWMWLSVGVNLGMLGVFKYFDFFLASATRLIEPLGIETGTLQIILPVGISFFTFQTMSYTIDVYRRKLMPIRRFADFALFVSFFPQLVAGPIVRAAHFLPQLQHRPRWRDVPVRRNLKRLLGGFIKKACIADAIAIHVDDVFSEPTLYTATAIWIAVLLYAVQIYCDFSGYTDMAIACAGLLGYDLGKNFDFPYLAVNLADFWRRWHISLSSWLRDYLYIPLGGSRGTAWKTARNLLLTMLLGGLWHGAAWTFVAWGGLHGLGLVVHRSTAQWMARRRSVRPERERSQPAPWGRSLMRHGRRVLATASTFYFVCCAWIFFRAQSFEDAYVILRGFVLFESPGEWTLAPSLLVLVAGLAAVHWLSSRRALTRLGTWIENRAPAPVFATSYGAAVALALGFLPLRAAPFIYFQF